MRSAAASLPLGQTWFIDRVEQSEPDLLYKDGACFGVAFMGMLAILAEDIDSFDERFVDVHHIPVKQFGNKLTKAKKSYTKFIRQNKKHVWQNLFPGLKQFDVNALTLAQKQFFEDEWHRNLQELRNKRPNILDIPIFFANVSSAQNPEKYLHLFPQNPIQDGKRIAQKIYPNVLKNKIRRLNQFIGIYNKQELNNYFKSLAQACDVHGISKPIALMLKSGDHAITVGYQPLTKQWLLIDANQLPTKRLATTQELVEKVMFSAIAWKETTMFATDVFVTSSNRQALSPAINSWKDQAKLKAFTEIAKEKINYVSDSNYSLMHIAALNGDIELVKKLLEAKVDCNQLTTDGLRPIDMAIESGHEKIVQLFLKEGVQPDRVYASGDTAFLMAAGMGFKKVVSILLANGALPDRPSKKDGVTPLLVAAQNGHTEIVKLLLATRRVNVKHIAFGSTALYYAAATGHEKVVNLLLPYYNMIENPLSPDIIKSLWQAAENGYAKVVKVFLNYGINPNQRNANDGVSLLLVAARNGYEGPVKLLLKHSADPNRPDNKGNAPLRLAARKGSVEIVEHLLSDERIQINATGTNNVTALFTAAQFGHEHIVKLLLSHKADDTIAFCSTIDVLLKIGEATNILDKIHRFIKTKKITSPQDIIYITPLEIAEMTGNERIVKMLKAAAYQRENNFSVFLSTVPFFPQLQKQEPSRKRSRSSLEMDAPVKKKVRVH